MSRMVGETLLYFISLPLFAFQTLMGIESLADVFAQVSEFSRYTK